MTGRIYPNKKWWINCLNNNVFTNNYKIYDTITNGYQIILDRNDICTIDLLLTFNIQFKEISAIFDFGILVDTELIMKLGFIHGLNYVAKENIVLPVTCVTYEELSEIYLKYLNSFEYIDPWVAFFLLAYPPSWVYTCFKVNSTNMISMNVEYLFLNMLNKIKLKSEKLVLLSLDTKISKKIVRQFYFFLIFNYEKLKNSNNCPFASAFHSNLKKRVLNPYGCCPITFYLPFIYNVNWYNICIINSNYNSIDKQFIPNIRKETTKNQIKFVYDKTLYFHKEKNEWSFSFCAEFEIEYINEQFLNREPFDNSMVVFTNCPTSISIFPKYNQFNVIVNTNTPTNITTFGGITLNQFNIVELNEPVNNTNLISTINYRPQLVQNRNTLLVINHFIVHKYRSKTLLVLNENFTKNVTSEFLAKLNIFCGIINYEFEIENTDMIVKNLNRNKIRAFVTVNNSTPCVLNFITNLKTEDPINNKLLAHGLFAILFGLIPDINSLNIFNITLWLKIMNGINLNNLVTFENKYLQISNTILLQTRNCTINWNSSRNHTNVLHNIYDLKTFIFKNGPLTYDLEDSIEGEVDNYTDDIGLSQNMFLLDPSHINSAKRFYGKNNILGLEVNEFLKSFIFSWIPVHWLNLQTLHIFFNSREKVLLYYFELYLQSHSTYIPCISMRLLRATNIRTVIYGFNMEIDFDICDLRDSIVSCLSKEVVAKLQKLKIHLPDD
jgi:hypothetical protein